MNPACHAAQDYTDRTSVMFGSLGFRTYISYMDILLLNIVTETEGFPAAVLIRGLKLTEPLEANLVGPGILMQKIQYY
ncbi:MAG: DNA-3-methyladenine glycosylase [Wolbachia sp.]